MAQKKSRSASKDAYREVYVQLIKMVGKDWVSNDPAILIGYSRDGSQEIARNPDIVALPETTEQVSRILKLAGKHGVPVVPWSVGASTGGSCIPQQGGIVLDMRRMDKILGIDEENMSIRVQQGVTFGKVYIESRKRGLRGASTSAPAATSMLASYLDNGVSSVSGRYGIGTDSILGMVIVEPDGSVIRTGCLFDDKYGSICVEGPGPDISGIFQGSMGTYGICTEMVAQLYPLPASQDILAVQHREGDVKGLVEFTRQVAREDCCFEMILLQDGYGDRCLSLAGAKAEKIRPQMPKRLHLVFYGGETGEEMQIRKEQLERIVRRSGAKLVPRPVTDLLRRIEPREKLLEASRLASGPLQTCGFRARYSAEVPADQAPEVARAFTGVAGRNLSAAGKGKSARTSASREVTLNVRPLEFGRTLVLELGASSSQGGPEGLKCMLALEREAAQVICESGGVCVGPGAGSDFPCGQGSMVGAYCELLKGIKLKLDPQGIMNPGRFGI